MSSRTSKRTNGLVFVTFLSHLGYSGVLRSTAGFRPCLLGTDPTGRKLKGLFLLSCPRLYHACISSLLRSTHKLSTD
ncbi:hypothetical protein RSAG8_00622, partial [Rhizoctonia solani AG-8 WAC10335]